MNLRNLTDQELVSLRDQLQDLHNGIINKVLFISGAIDTGIRLIISEPIKLKDKRLEDLIFLFSLEAHNELVSRFEGTYISTESLNQTEEPLIFRPQIPPVKPLDKDDEILF